MKPPCSTGRLNFLTAIQGGLGGSHKKVLISCAGSYLGENPLELTFIGLLPFSLESQGSLIKKQNNFIFILNTVQREGDPR